MKQKEQTRKEWERLIEDPRTIPTIDQKIEILITAHKHAALSYTYGETPDVITLYHKMLKAVLEQEDR